MKLFTKYISFIYIKYFLIVFTALELFYVGVDILTNLKDFPQSANLQLLYACLTALVAINYILPISLILAVIICFVALIRNNELVSFHALGIDKNSVILPVFFIALSITLVYILSLNTSFAYARDYQKNLMNARSSNTSSAIFLKFENKFIYINELDTNDGLARGVKIFEIDNGSIISQTTAKSAKYDGDKWILDNAKAIKLPSILDLNSSGYVVSKGVNTNVLDRFKPKTIQNIYETSNSYSISDALESLKALDSEGINTSKIKSSLYTMTFFPLFAPLTALILYYYMPAAARFASLAMTSFTQVIVILCLWGFLFTLTRFAQNGVIYPWAAIIAPIILLVVFAGFKFYKNR